MTFVLHIIRAIAGWVGASAAASIVFMLLGLFVVIYDDAVCDAACRTSRELLGLHGYTLGQKVLYLGGALVLMPFAMMITLPIMVVAYPLAAFVARRLRSPGRTAAAGALAALVLVLPFGAAWLAFDPSPPEPWSARRTIKAIVMWAPVIAAAGAALGWVVATLRFLRSTSGGGGTVDS